MIGSSWAVTSNERALTRREALQFAGAAAAIGAYLVPGRVSGSAKGSRRVSSQPAALNRSTFAPLVGQRFELRAEGRDRVTATLVEIRGLRSGVQRGTVTGDTAESFALLFHAPPWRLRLEQGVHQVVHPALGRVPLLLTPAGTGRGGQDYEAVINRLVHCPH